MTGAGTEGTIGKGNKGKRDQGNSGQGIGTNGHCVALRSGRLVAGAAGHDLTTLLLIHTWSARSIPSGGTGVRPPIPAKKPFVFRDMWFWLRRSYLILRELGCRYLSTRELWVFRDGSGDAPGVRAFLTRPLILIVRQRRELICKLFLGDSREGGWGSRSLILVSMKLRQGWVTEGPAAHSSR